MRLRGGPVPEAVSQTMLALCVVTQNLQIGTNLGLLHFLWMLLSGSLLPGRGALFPALQAIGLSPPAVRRAWAAFRCGAWEIGVLLFIWRQYVDREQRWQVRVYEGYYALAVDLTAFWRPRWKGCRTKHHHPQAGKALPAVVLGLIGQVGQIAGQRVAVLTALVRSDPDDPAEAKLQSNLVKRVAQTLKEGEMPVFDAGFKIRELQDAGLPRYVVRLAKNFTARRNTPAEYQGVGRPPGYGELVRPLARTYKGKRIAATPPDRTQTWTKNGIEFRAEFWDDLVLPDVKASPEAKTFYVAAVYDPRFTEPWLLASPVQLGGPAWRGLYRDRWPIEQVPLAGKQMIGSTRQFVSAPESAQRLPELILLAASILTYLAATLPATPTGFWDRSPKPTPGRLRRVLARTPFPNTYPLPGRIREKASVFDHLPKGVLGHRRQKQAVSA
jgi:hypothetical protein